MRTEVKIQVNSSWSEGTALLALFSLLVTVQEQVVLLFIVRVTVIYSHNRFIETLMMHHKPQYNQIFLH